MSATSGKSPLQHALGDGEDFELLLAVPAEEADRLLEEQPLDVRLTRVGTITSECGLWYRNDQGQRCPLAVEGYLH
jgi:thiamine-monophosphate kinase